MGLQMRRIYHQRISPAASIGQFQKHPGEDALLAPSLPPAVEGLVRPVLGRRIAPTQAIAVDEYYAAQHPFFVHTRPAVRLRKKGSNLAICVSLSQYRSLMSPLRLQSRESRSATEINAS